MFALAGCGGGGKPAIEPGVAQRLARQADAVAASAAAGKACAAARHATALQTATTRAINAHAIPPRYQETLLARATELVSELQVACLPSPAAAAPSPQPEEPGPASAPPGKGHGHGHGHGEKPQHGAHGHGRGKGDEQ